MTKSSARKSTIGSTKKAPDSTKFSTGKSTRKAPETAQAAATKSNAAEAKCSELSAFGAQVHFGCAKFSARFDECSARKAQLEAQKKHQI